ncbi:hypothetical protein GCM10025794_02140 [Massilia kyonggiensis]|nr:hypothetical protein [Massilia kyonggiensis]
MKSRFGQSLYYASDKNVFDALNRSRVTNDTIQELFLARNIIVSKQTQREELALYFSRLPHDLEDHKNISAKLGVVARQERLTTVEVKIAAQQNHYDAAINAIKSKLSEENDTMTVANHPDRIDLIVKYSSIDYRKSEFSQVQVRDGILSIMKTDDGYMIRSTYNDFMNSVRDNLVSEIEQRAGVKGERRSISLYSIQDPLKRSEFFHSLMSQMPGFRLKDVGEVYVFKQKPNSSNQNDEESEEETSDTHVERVLLRGSGVTRSKQLQDLIKKKDSEEPYYIVRGVWSVEEKGGIGNIYEIEARFENTQDCTGFSYRLRGVYPADIKNKTGVSKTKRQATRGEANHIGGVLEQYASELMVKFNAALTT